VKRKSRHGIINASPGGRPAPFYGTIEANRRVNKEKPIPPGEKFLNVKKCLIFAHPNGVVAQMVEQRTENPCVTGSIPVDATPKETENPDSTKIQGFSFSNCGRIVEVLIRYC
jgi:hypothetical protein